MKGKERIEKMGFTSVVLNQYTTDSADRKMSNRGGKKIGRRELCGSLWVTKITFKALVLVRVM